MCTGMELPAMVAMYSAIAGGAAAVKTAGQKAPEMPAPQQPEKSPVMDLFKRRSRTGGAYGMPDAGSTGAASTGTTLLGQ